MVDGAAVLGSIFHGLRAGGAWGGPRGANLLDGGAPFYDTYACADGRHLSVAALEPKFFAELVQRLGLDPAWTKRQYDQRQWPALRAALAEAIAAQPRDHWAALFDASDACVAPVLDLAEAAQHPHATARGAYVDVAGVVQPAPAPRFSRSRPMEPRPAPEIGADTEAVLLQAGFDADEIAVLRASGVAR
jgi:alpha-methylacyl-CoA racemase